MSGQAFHNGESVLGRLRSGNLNHLGIRGRSSVRAYAHGEHKVARSRGKSVGRVEVIHNGTEAGYHRNGVRDIDLILGGKSVYIAWQEISYALRTASAKFLVIGSREDVVEICAFVV